MKNNSILWAIDPYQKDRRIWNRSKQLASVASRSLGCSLQPVYVANRSAVSSGNALDPEEINRFVNKSEGRMGRRLASLKLRGVNKPEIILSDDIDNIAEAKLLSSFSAKNGSSLIIAATNARKGVKRIVQGSFAEALVQTSKIPVILASPLCKPVKQIRRIVFATDFSALSRKALYKACETAQAAKASLEIVSILPVWSSPGVDMMPGSTVSIGKDYLLADRKRALRFGSTLVKIAQKYGIPASFSLECVPGEKVSTALLKFAKLKNADILALVSRADTSKVHFFGTIVQDVIRNSPVPVWIYHAKSKDLRANSKNRNKKRRI